jgi:murein DD-endopeptidase MepM/ murein hydrolase activator NlpD
MGQKELGQGTAARRRSLVRRIFPERQIICRSEGRTTYLRLSTSFQIFGTLVLIAAAAWLATASAMLTLRDAPPVVALASSVPVPDPVPVPVPAPPPPLVTQEELKADLERVRAALVDLAGEKSRTSESREQLTRQVDELERRLKSLLHAQQSYFDSFGTKSAPDLAAVERAIRSIGLDPDKLLTAGTRADGTGGPFIPLPRSRAEAKQSDPATAGLVADMSQIERQYARWTKLQGVVEHLPLDRPTAEGGVSSGFGPRLDPFTGQPAYHEGLDIQGRSGAPVEATAAGTVAIAGTSGPYGNMVEIDHGMGFKTRYAHLHRIEVKVGDAVARHQEIGTIGSTGRSAGTHLHYEIRFRDDAIDPTNFIEAGRHVLKLEQEAAGKHRS